MQKRKHTYQQTKRSQNKKKQKKNGYLDKRINKKKCIKTQQKDQTTRKSSK